MALKEEIGAIVSTLSGQPAFYYGTSKEVNLKADDIDPTNGVVFMFALQPVQNEFTTNKSISNSYAIYMEFLFKVDFDTFTAECEPYDVAAIAMYNEFLVKLANYRGANGGKVFKINVKDISKSDQVFNAWDVNMVGRNLKIDKLQTFYNDKICF